MTGARCPGPHDQQPASETQPKNSKAPRALELGAPGARLLELSDLEIPSGVWIHSSLL